MKLSITIGKTGNEMLVVNGPSLDWDGQVAALKELTTANGLAVISGKDVQLDEAIVFHSSGRTKGRKFNAPKKPAKKVAKKAVKKLVEK